MTRRSMFDWCVIAFGAFGILCGLPEPLAWATFVIGLMRKAADAVRSDVAIFIRRKEQ